MNNLRGRLTRYSEGSMQELWAISFPMMLSLLSINLMTFADRLILSKYDTQAMNSAVIADLVFNMFQFGAMGIASISEVFVGQFNGARKYRRIGEIVWQMVWFSLGSVLFFVPMGLFAGPYLIPDADYISGGLSFFKWMMFFGPFFPLHAALASFLIGQGRVKLVMKVTLISNLLNILLDFILIFGVGESIPAMGATGAAIATGVAQMVQALVLLVIFLRPCHRKAYGTGIWHFKPKLFWQIFQVGCPRAVSDMMALSAWCVLSQIVARMSEAHSTIFSIGDSFYTLFAFSFWGVQRGITAVVSNYIGANRDELVDQCLKSGFKIILIMMMVFSIPLLFFPEVLVRQFLSEQSAVINDELMTYASSTMRWLWVYFALDAMAWVVCGVLTAVNDTKYVMVMNTISTWMFAVVPIYFCLIYLDSSPDITWMLCALSGFINVTSFYLRYRSRRWSATQALHAYT